MISPLSRPLRLLALCLLACLALPLFASGPQVNFTARPEADPFGNVDVKWFSRRGGLYDFQYTESLSSGQWTSLFNAYATETTDMAVRVWNAPPLPDGPPAPAPAHPKDYAITLVRNGPQTLLVWESPTPDVGMVRIRVAQDWNLPGIPPIATYNSTVTVAGQPYSLTLILK